MQEQLQEEQSGTLVALKDALLRANPLIPAELLDKLNRRARTGG